VEKTSRTNPAHDTISTTPVWEFRNANAITKFIGVFIAADLRPFSVVDKQAVFLYFPRYVPNRDFCVLLHPYLEYIVFSKMGNGCRSGRNETPTRMLNW
jgi:hypothetical protein